MKSRYLVLLTLVLLSEAKALFYNSDLKVSWYLFSDTKRHLCNVVEDYANIIIFAFVFYHMAFVKIDNEIRNICVFLFILTILDFIHLGLMDTQYFILFKLLLTFIIFKICKRLNRF